jgi:hypothetical protein
MEKKIETIEVVAKDFYGDNCLNDSISTKTRIKGAKPEGYVEIYEVDDSGNKKLVGKSNLVLYVGREWIAQRIVDIANVGVPSSKDEYITWFGLGDGGVILGDPLNPTPPTLGDTALSSQIMITTVAGTVADYNTADATHPETGYYKMPFDSVAFEQDILNDDKWLVIKIITTVGITYANEKEISEAGLFTAESSVGGYSGQFTLFSRVTFPSIVKTSDRRLIFSWFLYV